MAKNLEPAAKKARTGAGDGNAAGVASGSHANGGPAPLMKLEFGTHGEMPVLPALGSAPKTWEAYYAKMVGWVRKVMPTGLQQFNIQLSDVEVALPTRIEENLAENGRNALTTFRGDWDVAACVQAMESTSMYENCGSAHWLNVKSGKVEFAGEVLMDEHTPWTQVVAALHCWSWDRYMNSSEKVNLRRLIFPVTVPSACHSTVDAQKSIKVVKTRPPPEDPVTEERPTFKDCPVLAGRAHILAMYFTMGQCMAKWSQQDQTHFLKLWEACYQNFHLVMPFPDPPCPWKWGNYSGGLANNLGQLGWHTCETTFLVAINMFNQISGHQKSP